MARTAKPQVDKLKDQIIDLPNEDAQAIQEWLDMLLEVREQEAARNKRIAATQQSTATPPGAPKES